MSTILSHGGSKQIHNKPLAHNKRILVLLNNSNNNHRNIKSNINNLNKPLWRLDPNNVYMRLLSLRLVLQFRRPLNRRVQQPKLKKKSSVNALVVAKANKMPRFLLAVIFMLAIVVRIVYMMVEEGNVLF